MINLMVDDISQVTWLDVALCAANIKYDIEIDDKSWGICPPFLIVDGVPLDLVRAIKWITSKRSKDNA